MMKRILNLLAAVSVAFSINAQTQEVIKVTSGNVEWGQMYVENATSGTTYESATLQAKSQYASTALKDADGAELTFSKTSKSTQTYYFEFEEEPSVKLQVCVNCAQKNQYGGGPSTMAYKPLTIENKQASVTISADDCFFKGKSYKQENGSWVQDQDYSTNPINEDVVGLTLQACDGTFPATIKVKSVKRVVTGELPTYSYTLANLDFSTEGASPIGGWGGNFSSKIENGVDVISFTKQTNPWDVQVDFENIFPKNAKIKLTMEVKGSVEGSIKAGLQNPNGYKGCGDFADIALTTEYKTVSVTAKCIGDACKRILLNVGAYDGTIYLKNVKIEIVDAPQEVLTVNESSYSTYTAYYPVNYSSLGLKAYSVKLNDNKDGITLTEITGVVPAGVTVLVQGEANKEYTLTKVEGWQKVDTDLKISDGTITSSDATSVYGLATVNGQDGFWKATSGKTIPAKCGYLEVAATASHASFYSLGGGAGTTAIANVKAEAATRKSQMYNLAGQAVGKGYKGIVIKNGKKIILK